MDNVGGGTPPVYTTTDIPSCNAQDILPIITVLLIFLVFFLMLCFVRKKTDKTVDEQEQLNKLKEYKKLLDEGVITQEDYEEKKKQILKL